MIAICREDSKRKSREERYALRRILVSRLQRACRGIPRRTRFETHRLFADEWSRFAREDRLDLVQRALVVGPAVAAEAGENWRTSLLLNLAANVTRPVADAPVPRRAIVSTAPESAGERAPSALDSAGGPAAKARSWSAEGRSVGLQEDLFPPRLVPQPV